MKIAFRLALLALAAGLGFWLWTILFPSPEKVVLKKVADLAATATIKAGDGNIKRATKVSNLIGYFSTDVEIVFDISGVGARTLSGRDELRETAAGAFTQLSSVNVQFFDATAKVTADKQSAVVTCTARVSVGDGKDFGIQELRFQFKKIDSDWRITRAETVKTLK
jgi:hypothetical protein